MSNPERGKSILILVLVFSVFVFPPSAFSVVDRERAAELTNEGRFEEAETLFREELEVHPSDAEAHFELANLFAAEFDQAVREGSDERAQEKLQAAAKELEQALLFRPDHIPAHFNLGVIYKKQARYEEAREQFREVLRLDPQQSNAVIQMGSTYQDQGFFDEAESLYREVSQKTGQDITPLLEDLDRARIEAQEQEAGQSGLSQLARMQQMAVPNAGGSDSSLNPAQNAGVAQAIPYVGSWLMQQLMRSKNSEKT